LTARTPEGSVPRPLALAAAPGLALAAALGLALAAALGLALTWSLAGPLPPAGAHAVALSTSPPPGALLDDPPQRVVVEFNEPVQVGAGSLRVIDQTGAAVGGPPQAVGSSVVAEVPAGLRGWYAVSWRVVSADGHPVSGAWTFRVGEGADAPPDQLAERAEAAFRPAPVVRWGWWAGQAVSGVAAAVLVGTVFLAAAGVAPGRRLVPLAAAAGVTALAASVTAAAFNGPFTHGGAVLDSVFQGPASGAHLARAGLAALVAAAAATLARGARTGTWAVWAAAAAALMAPAALSGHAAAGGAAARVVVAAHLVVGACWLGAVPALVLATRGAGTAAWDTLGRFSAAATRLVLAAAVLGGAGAWLLTDGFDGVRPVWGWLLAAKVALVAAAVAAGAWVRWRVLPARAGRHALRPPLAVEAGALVAVVVLSVALGHHGPPSQPAEAAMPQVDLAVTDDLRVQVVLEPGRTGTNWVHVYTLDRAGLPVDVEGLDLALSLPAAGIEGIDQRLSNVGSGHLIGLTDDIGLAGQWLVTVTVRTGPGQQLTASGTIDVPR
jgi:copper transport protein